MTQPKGSEAEKQEPTDSELVTLAVDGNPHAFRLLVERHYMMMYKVAYKWCGVREDAEDIAQNASIKLARGLESYRHDAPFTTWLYRLVINTAKDYFRSRNRDYAREKPMEAAPQGATDGIDPENHAIAAEMLQMVADLPEKLKEAVVLVFCEGLSHSDAAEILDCKEATISWRIHEARKILNETLDKERRHG